MAANNFFIPLKLIIPWPQDSYPEQIDDSGSSFLYKTGISTFSLAEENGRRILCFTLQWRNNTSLGFVGLEDFSILFENEDSEGEATVRLEAGENSILEISDLTVLLRLPEELFNKAVLVGEHYASQTDEIGNTLPCDLTLEKLSFSLDLENDLAITFADELPSVSLPPTLVGNTGITIVADGVRPCFSSSMALVLATEYPKSSINSESRGIFIDLATIYLPEGLPSLSPDDISIKDFFIGSGGFSGWISSNWGEGTLSKSLFGFTFDLSSLSIKLQQNTISDFSILGTLTLPFFNGDLAIEIGLTNDGDFLISIDSEEGLKEISGDFFTLTLTALSIGKDNDDYYIELSGTLSFNDSIDIELPDISVNGLRIYSDGSVSIKGGGITLEQQEVIDLYGFQLQLDTVGFGSEGEENFISFSGGIRFTDDLGASVESFRIWWNGETGKFSRISLDSVGVSFEIPNVLSFEGEVALVEKEFKGSIDVKLMAVDLALTAEIIIGEATSGSKTFKYFKIDLSVTTPFGIPLAATGLAFYGFSGTFIKHMSPDADSSTDGFSWYDDWYIKGKEFAAAYGEFGFGVGTTIGTLPDNGFTFSTNIAFLILFPGPVVMLEGVGNILRKRSSLPDNHVFDSLIVFDGNAKTLLAALGLTYELPSDDPLKGYVLVANGTAEGFFDLNNAKNGHIYLGEEDEDKRIRADLLKLFKADAYLMLDSDSLRAGASIGFGDTYDFKVVKITAEAYISGEAEVSWAPQHLYGSLELLGSLIISCAKFDLGLSLEAAVSGQTPTPYEFNIDASVKINLPWPLKDITLKIEIDKEESHDPAAITPLLEEENCICIRDYKSSDSWSLSLQDDSNEDNSNSGVYQVVAPLDSRAVLIFNRNLSDPKGIGTPEPNIKDEIVGDPDGESYTKYNYELTDLKLEKWVDDKWTEPDVKLYASWQATGDEAGTEIELYGDGPFSFTKETITGSSGEGGTWLSWTPYADAFLENNILFPATKRKHVINFRDFNDGQNLGNTVIIKGVTFTAKGADIIISKYPYGLFKGIHFFESEAKLKFILDNKNEFRYLAILFPREVNNVSLKVYFLDISGETNEMKVTGYLNDNELSPIVKSSSIGGDDSIVIPGTINKLHIEGNNVYLVSVLYTTSDEKDLSADGSRICSDERYVFDSNCYYRITATTTTYTNSVAADPVTLYAFFKTEGPPDDLTPYIDRMVLVNNGNPHLRDYNIQIICNENHVVSMYNSALKMRVLDINGADITDENGTPVSFTLQSSKGDDDLAYYADVWLDTIKQTGVAVDCDEKESGVDTMLALIDSSLSLPANQKLEVRLEYDGKTLWSSFLVTSAYKNFSELIGDFRTTPWATILDSGASPDISSGDFDTIYYESLLLPVKSLPTNPEITIIKNSDGDILFLLVDFPEPVDWERMSLEINNEDGLIKDLLVIKNIDNCRFLLYQLSGSSINTWKSGLYSFTFTYTLSKSGLHTLFKNGKSDAETPSPISITIE